MPEGLDLVCRAIDAKGHIRDRLVRRNNGERGPRAPSNFIRVGGPQTGQRRG
jgi:hypothetical protein